MKEYSSPSEMFDLQDEFNEYMDLYGFPMGIYYFTKEFYPVQTKNLVINIVLLIGLKFLFIDFIGLSNFVGIFLALCVLVGVKYVT